MVSEIIAPGALVRIKEEYAGSAWFANNFTTKSVGIVIKGPEPFGFIDRCYIMWSTTANGPRLSAWSNLDDLELISESR